MVRNVEYRIMENRPGPGWYWEVVEALARDANDPGQAHHRDG